MGKNAGLQQVSLCLSLGATLGWALQKQQTCCHEDATQWCWAGDTEPRAAGLKNVNLLI